MNTFRSLLAVLLLTIVPLTAMGQKVVPDWAKPGYGQKPKEEKKMTIKKIGNEKVELIIVDAYRYAGTVKLEFTLINNDKVSLKGLTMGKGGSHATKVVSSLPVRELYSTRPLEYYTIREIQWGKVYDYEGGRKITIHEIKPGESVRGWMIINADEDVDTLIAALFEFRRTVQLNYRGDTELKKVEFHVENIPIRKFEITEKGVGTLDCTQPISKFPKRVYKLYDRMETEELVNEMDGYTETRVRFFLKDELVMVGLSTDEGPEKRFDQMTFWSKRISTPNGLAPGMPIKHFCEKGGYIRLQYWETWFVQGDNWMSSEGEWYEKLNSSARRSLEGQHDTNTRRNEAAVTKMKVDERSFAAGCKISSITRFYKK